MPELRLVVLALQDRLAYGPTFEAAMQALFGGQTSSLTAAVAPSEPSQTTTAAPHTPAAGNASDRNALIAAAAQDLADYQRLTADGKLAEAGQKLEDLKHKLVQLQAGQK
jgi:hypothetical protein